MKRRNSKMKIMSSAAMAALLVCGCGSTSQSNNAAGTNKNQNGASAQTYEMVLETAAATEAIAAEYSNDSISGQYQSIYSDGEFNTEEYKHITENGFKSVADEPLSTFAIDVDTAAYSNIRRMIRSGAAIPEDAVRIEEMINYFSYDYKEPEEGEPFSVTTEYSDCAWNEDSRLLMIGLKAKDIDFQNRPASNFVFLLDVSGSMYSDDKLPLVQKSFALLAENLTEKDRVSIVTYAGYETVVLEGESGANTSAIIDAIESLHAGGSTAGAAGIQKAYELAERNFIRGGNNRVILATDGDLNVGISSEGGLTNLIKKKKENGVHLSVIGVGTGNIKDNKMKALADNGDGNYSYIDSIFEAKKVLVDEMGGTLITVAKDVKIQVEFNPAEVAGYRLVGYESRLLNKEDFNDDTVDGGEIGAGHTVTALYEIIPADSSVSLPKSELKYQTEGTPVGSTDLLTVNIRYKAPNGNTSKLLSYPVDAASYREEPSGMLTFASAVAQFGMVLRNSDDKGTATYDSILEQAEFAYSEKPDQYREEFLDLVKTVNGR